MALALPTNNQALNMRDQFKKLREILNNCYEGIKACAQCEVLYQRSGLFETRGEYLRRITEIRAQKRRFEMVARQYQQYLEEIYERADRLGIILEDGMFPRLKHYWSRLCDYFQDHPPPNDGTTPFGIPESMIFLLVIFFYFYL